MTKLFALIATLVAAVGFSECQAAPAWIAESNKIAEEYTLEWAKRYPEGASRMGYRKFDGAAIRLQNDMEREDRKFYEKWRSRLKDRLKREKNPEVQVDLQVLLNEVELNLEGLDVQRRHGEIPFYAASKFVFNNLQSLINAQSPAERKKAAVTRFKGYVNGHHGLQPLITAMMTRTLHAKSQTIGGSHLWPLRQEVEQYLKDSPDFVRGVRDLLSASGRDDWQKEFAKFESQVKLYDEFVRIKILPESRTKYQLPRDYYAFLLKNGGIRDTPEELIRVAEADFQKTYAQFESVAKEVARKLRISKSDPVSVIQALKKNLVTDIVGVQALFLEADRILTDTLIRHDLITLPKTALRIRVADTAESKALPVPHLKIPPLIKNAGERPEFVVPAAADGRLAFDDFSYPPAAIALTAHEGRPGHDLQYTQMLEKGMSVIRATYAFNSVNVEGWALYAEDLVLPHVGVEARLELMKMRLWRIARMFLDPQIQLGLITPEKVIETYTRKVGLSQALAELEVRRYTYDSPGQAPSYYYGLLQLWRAKERVKARLGATFREKCFNDAVVAMGLLPVQMVADRLEATLKCEGPGAAVNP